MHIVGIVVIYLFLQMSVMWGLYRLLKNPSVIDVSWSLGLMISGFIYLSMTALSLRIMVIGFLLMVWALRLAGYLWYTRIKLGHVDKRYTELSNDWKISPSVGFFINFQFQGLLILVISSVFFLTSQSDLTTITSIDLIGFFIVALGIIGETVADLQLQHFKSQFKGQVCNIGLWQYSRHPNYFFDWLSWVGFAVFGIQSSMGIFAIISPLVLYIIFTQITGPLTERGSIQSRGKRYADYQQQTSFFFPWFKKKIDSA